MRLNTGNVFINCPFDRKYARSMNAIVFTIMGCGFTPRSALESNDNKIVRIRKIINLIAECLYGVHDISRIGLDGNKRPRFNMPFELGMDLGCAEYGNAQQRTKKILIMESEKYEFQKYISDLAGHDVFAHNNSLEKIIKHVRDFLSTESKGALAPGHKRILQHFNSFEKILPKLARENKLDCKTLTYHDNVTIIKIWLQENPL